jgi:Papain family cysteine protease
MTASPMSRAVLIFSSCLAISTGFPWGPWVGHDLADVWVQDNAVGDDGVGKRCAVVDMKDIRGSPPALLDVSDFSSADRSKAVGLVAAYAARSALAFHGNSCVGPVDALDISALGESYIAVLAASGINETSSVPLYLASVKNAGLKLSEGTYRAPFRFSGVSLLPRPISAPPPMQLGPLRHELVMRMLLESGPVITGMYLPFMWGRRVQGNWILDWGNDGRISSFVGAGRVVPSWDASDPDRWIVTAPWIHDYERASTDFGNNTERTPMLLFGWGKTLSAAATEFWMAKGTWGTSWAEEGCLRVQRDVGFSLGLVDPNPELVIIA